CGIYHAGRAKESPQPSSEEAAAMSFRLSSMFLFLLLAHLAFTQEPPSSPPDQPSVKELLRRIDRLEKRVNELEANEHNPIAIRAASASQQPAPPVQSPQPDTASACRLMGIYPVPSCNRSKPITHRCRSTVLAMWTFQQ